MKIEIDQIYTSRSMLSGNIDLIIQVLEIRKFLFILNKYICKPIGGYYYEGGYPFCEKEIHISSFFKFLFFTEYKFSEKLTNEFLIKNIIK